MPYRLGLLITRHGAIERDLEQESLIGYVWEWVARGNRVLHPGCMAPWAKSLIDLGSWIAQSRVIVPEQTEWSSDGCTFHLVQIKWQRLLLMEMLRNWLVCAATNSRKHTHTHTLDRALEWIHPGWFSGFVLPFLSLSTDNNTCQVHGSYSPAYMHTVAEHLVWQCVATAIPWILWSTFSSFSSLFCPVFFNQ